MFNRIFSALIIFYSFLLFISCNQAGTSKPAVVETSKHDSSETPEYFLLRPEVEKAYGYSHAVKIGNDIKISGAVSMDDKAIRLQKEICFNK